ncbi:MarR family winged helix-turn-helix transcriptional regulator [Geosporobacter ferrireducens]|uniref:MarR family winged helix-turn-helix transcriptional regulator n=1 Tax=Geosporobacter ferrireducens TaxID=1424294 RepID=UPI00139EFF27|nr:MarR family transcriptional regulator [Geosporobacter ferrireducens]MTI55899.1 MarR family transcriptional regulator [Geosporobacter ferrireducens]
MMNINDLKNMRISYMFLEVIYRCLEVDKKTRYYGTDVPIFHSEIHMIKAIKENEGIHVAGLANYLGVTKGSISEITAKLEKKGLVKKEKDINNQSRLILQLTPKGETAHKNHLAYHEKFDDILIEILKNEPEEKIKFLKDFLVTLRDKAHTFEEEIDT